MNRIDELWKKYVTEANENGDYKKIEDSVAEYTMLREQEAIMDNLRSSWLGKHGVTEVYRNNWFDDSIVMKVSPKEEGFLYPEQVGNFTIKIEAMEMNQYVDFIDRLKFSCKQNGIVMNAKFK